METYVILRRGAWSAPSELEATAARSSQIGDEEMSDQVRWIRSYVTAEESGEVGTFCIYEATSPEALREHATRVDMPAHEVLPVADTVIVRPDPAASPA